MLAQLDTFYFLTKGSQHTCLEANESRLVTKIRWVIEAVNGLIKKWKALDHVVPNSQIPNIGDYSRIVCAVCNAFRPPRITENPDHLVITNRMISLLRRPNALQERVEKEGWSRKRLIWESLNANAVSDFSRLSMNELTQLTIGSYQLKQAKSYTGEHVHDDGLYELSVHKQCRNVIRVQIQSRHTLSKIYNLWIEYVEEVNPIKSWYCQCKAGARTVLVVVLTLLLFSSTWDIFVIPYHLDPVKNMTLILMMLLTLLQTGLMQ